MTARGRRPGRPVFVFDIAARRRYLAAVAAGARLADAAKAADIAPRTAQHTAKTEPAFADALATAKRAGKTVRAEQLAHGEYRYNHGGCRCPICTKAASEARGGRRHPQPAEQPPAPIHPDLPWAHLKAAA